MQNNHKRNHNPAGKFVIGLTGGVGSGKSRVLALLRDRFGAETIQADEVAHLLMKPGQAGLKGVVQSFGPAILKEDHSLDKEKLSDLIFREKNARQTIDKIIHPMVWQWIDNKISASQSELIVVEFAIMDYEQRDFYDELWYVFTVEEERIKRLAEGRGYSMERTKAMMRSQLSENEYRRCCDRVIDNNGTIEEVEAQLKAIINSGLHSQDQKAED